MQFTTTQDAPVDASSDCLIIGLTEDGQPGSSFQAIDQASDGLLSRLNEAGELPRKIGKTLVLHAVPGVTAARVLIAGLGKTDKLDGVRFYKASCAAGKALRQSRATSAHCLLTEANVADRDLAWKTRQAALGLAWSDYVYSATKKPDADAFPPTERVSFPHSDEAAGQTGIAEAVQAGIQLCRDLGDLPPNICNPGYLVDTARRMAQEHPGLEVEILDEERMAELDMNSLLAVGQGSANPSYLIHLSWRGGPDEDRPLALVGKGITFDTGGISLKPRDLMEQMKFDMCGAATALGVMAAVAHLKLPLNVDCIVAAVENMPDGKAYRPGDVITTMSGKTVEVHNTDAEGRMILADALTWTGQFFSPPRRYRHADRRLRGRPGPPCQRRHDPRRCAGRRTARGRKRSGRPRLATAAVGRLPGANRYPVRRHEKHRRHAGRQHHGRLLPVALRRRPALGPPGHRRLGLAVGQAGKRLRATGRAFGPVAGGSGRRLEWAWALKVTRDQGPGTRDQQNDAALDGASSEVTRSKQAHAS